MNQRKPMIVPKRERVPGLRPWCSKCSREIGGGKCGGSGKSIRTCTSTEHHMYKAFVKLPIIGRKTKELGTRDLTEAMIEKQKFVESLKSQSQSIGKELSKEKTATQPMLLIECMASYLGFLNNEGVEPHMVKQRTSKHLWSVENDFAKFCKALKHHGIDHKMFRIDQLNDKVVAYYHTYAIEVLKHSNKTYNKMMALMRQFLNWLITHKGYDISNPFVLVQRRVENKDTTVISESEFNTLLSVITKENRYHVLPSGERKNRYKEWLGHCFRLALETGLRREEFMCLQFSDIVTDEKGKPLFLKVENYKVNRIRGGNDKSKNMKSVPITKGLAKLLDELGYKTFQGTDQFLLGHDEKASRNTLIDFVSKAFTHYWKQTGIERIVQLKHLRKTYMTALVEHFGDKAPMISDHSGIKVLKDHYVNNERLVSASKNFSIFH